MEFKAIISSKGKDFLPSFENLLKEYFNSFEVYSGDVIELIVNDESNFVFSLKQIQSILFNDFGLNCSIVVVPFFHQMFHKYIPFSSNNCLTLYELFMSHLDSNIVLGDMKSIVDFLGKDAIDTLSNYLDNNCDANKTAEMLFLHRNSFAYRLKNIVLKTGFEYNDINSLLLIKLCLVKKG